MSDQLPNLDQLGGVSGTPLTHSGPGSNSYGAAIPGSSLTIPVSMSGFNQSLPPFIFPPLEYGNRTMLPTLSSERSTDARSLLSGFQSADLQSFQPPPYPGSLSYLTSLSGEKSLGGLPTMPTISGTPGESYLSTMRLPLMTHCPPQYIYHPGPSKASSSATKNSCRSQPSSPTASPAPSVVLSPNTSHMLQSAIESDNLMSLSPGAEAIPQPMHQEIVNAEHYDDTSDINSSDMMTTHIQTLPSSSIVFQQNNSQVYTTRSVVLSGEQQYQTIIYQERTDDENLDQEVTGLTEIIIGSKQEIGKHEEAGESLFVKPNSEDKKSAPKRIEPSPFLDPSSVEIEVGKEGELSDDEQDFTRKSKQWESNYRKLNPVSTSPGTPKQNKVAGEDDENVDEDAESMKSDRRETPVEYESDSSLFSLVGKHKSSGTAVAHPILEPLYQREKNKIHKRRYIHRYHGNVHTDDDDNDDEDDDDDDHHHDDDDYDEDEEYESFESEYDHDEYKEEQSTDKNVDDYESDCNYEKEEYEEENEEDEDHAVTIKAASHVDVGGTSNSDILGQKTLQIEQHVSDNSGSNLQNESKVQDGNIQLHVDSNKHDQSKLQQKKIAKIDKQNVCQVLKDAPTIEVSSDNDQHFNKAASSNAIFEKQIYDENLKNKYNKKHGQPKDVSIQVEDINETQKIDNGHETCGARTSNVTGTLIKHKEVVSLSSRPKKALVIAPKPVVTSQSWQPPIVIPLPQVSQGRCTILIQTLASTAVNQISTASQPLFITALTQNDNTVQPNFPKSSIMTTKEISNVSNMQPPYKGSQTEIQVNKADGNCKYVNLVSNSAVNVQNDVEFDRILTGEIRTSNMNITPETQDSQVQDNFITSSVEKGESDTTRTCKTPLPTTRMRNRIFKSKYDTSVVLDSPVIDGPPTTHGNYCVDCNKMYADDKCPKHDLEYQKIPDTLVLSRARMSLPRGLLLRSVFDQDSPNYIGVIAEERIDSRTKFGPLVGIKTTKDKMERPEDTAYVWELFDDGNPHLVLDCRNEEQSNWMMFVKRARTSIEQNLMVYQQEENICFISCKTIEPGSELLYWYARDYARMLGVATRPEDFFRCPHCHRQFPDMRAVRQHIKYLHPNISRRKHKCSTCNRAFATTTKLNNHMMVHMGVKPYQCSTCGKNFSDSSNLRKHQHLHSGEGARRFVCEICGKKFKQKTHLQGHMNTHTRGQTFQCRFCEKSYSRSHDLRVHEYTHTLEKYYACELCDKVFYKTQNFKKHMKIHNNERDFKCSHCAKGFITKYHLDRHLQKCLKKPLNGRNNVT